MQSVVLGATTAVVQMELMERRTLVMAVVVVVVQLLQLRLVVVLEALALLFLNTHRHLQ
jgi:hypothetical protein